MDALIVKIKNALVDHTMIEPGDCVLVGVSGGPDSVALLQALFELKQELSVELVIAHLNHGTRGEDSDRDARFVKDLGAALKIKTFIEKQNVVAQQLDSGNSFQETARHIRQEFFQRTMSQTGANKVALGHTADDQVETVLINLLRGSGLQGVAGMSPVRLPYIRPLFYCSRSEVVAFLNDRKISYCMDSSNLKTDYLRNRIRLELIPFLQKNYNPRIAENLFESSEIFRADNAYLKMVEDREFERVVLGGDETDSLTMDVEYFAKLPLALQRRLIRKGIFNVMGDLRRISFIHIQEVLELFDPDRNGKKVDLPGNLEVRRRNNRVEFKRIHKSSSRISINNNNASGWMKPLNIPGETPVDKAGLVLKAEIIDPDESGISAGEANQAFLDFDKTGRDIRIRFFQAGDRLSPLGMTGTKKLKSLFIDEKVPQEMRSTIPILTTRNNDIIWVYGTRIAHAYRVTSETSKVLFIRGLA